MRVGIATDHGGFGLKEELVAQLRAVGMRSSISALTDQARIDRYFEAFETGPMKLDLCNGKVQVHKTQMEELNVDKQELGARDLLSRRSPSDRGSLHEDPLSVTSCR